MDEKRIGRFAFIACTAIATQAGDTEEQPAIFCFDTEPDGCKGDTFCVLFGYTLDEIDDETDFSYDYFDYSDDTLATVRIDGLPISAWCF